MKQPTECMTLRLWPEVARALGVSRSTIYKAVKRGEIPVVKIGGRLLVPKAALARLLMVEPQPGSGEVVWFRADAQRKRQKK